MTFLFPPQQFFISIPISRKFPTYERLDLSDLEELIDLALEFRDYALVIDLIKNISQSITHSMKSIRFNEKLFRRIEDMKIDMAKLNNAIHKKGKAFIGTTINYIRGQYT